jgi:hypothetical protein
MDKNVNVIGKAKIFEREETHTIGIGWWVLRRI